MSSSPKVPGTLLDQVRSLRDPQNTSPGLQSNSPRLAQNEPGTSATFSDRGPRKEQSSQSSDSTVTNGISSSQKLPGQIPFSSIPKDANLSATENFKVFLSSGTKTNSPVMSTDSPQRPKPTRSASALSTNSSHSPSNSTPPGMTTRTMPVTMLRDPSIDSFQSSHSSNLSMPTAPSGTNTSGRPFHSSNTSVDTGESMEQDMDALIARHGSAEAALKEVLRQNRSLNSKNSQTWELLQKQRNMIFALKGDNEKLVKDRAKIKHRLKQKEQMSVSTALPSESGATEKHIDGSSRGVIGSRPSLDQDESPIANVGYPEVESSLLNGINQAIGPASSRGLQSREEESLDQRKQQAVPAPLHLRAGSGAPGPSSPEAARTPMGTMLTGSVASPSSPSGESRRKKLPTPLNLGHFHSPTTAYHQPQQDQPQDRPSVESIVELSPQEARGRRKTREDDDRQREASHAEEEHRSRSMKKSKSKSKTTPTDEHEPTNILPAEPPAGLANGVGLPSSPRAPLLGGLQSPPFQAPLGSLAGMLAQPGARPMPDHAGLMPSAPAAYNLKSPGLPMSPRPSDRPVNAAIPRIQHTLAAPLMSPGPISARGGILSPRPPRQPIALPTELHTGFPISDAVHTGPPTQRQPSLSERMQARRAEATSHGPPVADAVGPVYHGFMNDEYPELLLPPTALPRVFVSVYSSRMRPSRHSLNASRESEDDQVFTLAVQSKADRKQLWRLERTLQSLTSFDSALRRSSTVTARLPDKGLFGSHAPIKVDQRRAALNDYFGGLLESSYNDPAALIICSFLGLDAIGPKLASDPLASRSSFEHRLRKEGYLSKKGRRASKWTARYFVLDGRDLQYYEAPGSEHLGTIRMHRAQIGPQTGEGSISDSEYRHGFVILTPKRDDSSSLEKHILCAESDEERDDWINALKTYVEGAQIPPSPGNSSNSPRSAQKSRPPAVMTSAQARNTELQSLGYDQTVAAEAPTIGNGGDSDGSSPVSLVDQEMGRPSILSPGIMSAGERPAISIPLAGGPIQNASAWGNKAPSKEKRNIFGFKSRNSEDNAPRSPAASQSTFRQHSGRPIFGIQLAEAATLFPPRGIDICLPSPVYRCIEYLEAKNAARQEGLFRVSGSQTVIQALKQRFNSESDVDLVEEKPDVEIMAVADLLRLYCRELPEPVLTREMTIDFYKVQDVKQQFEKVTAFNILVHRLPEANFELLATISRYLFSVVANAAENKMHERNLATIWSSSLNVPFPMMVLFITEYKIIFGDGLDEASSPVIQSLASSNSTSQPHDSPDPSMSDLRSPRKQMFTDLATPGPTQSSFGQDASTSQSRLRIPQPQVQSQSGDYTAAGVPSTQAQSQQTYRMYQPIQPPGTDQGFGSLNAALAPRPPPLKNTELSKELKKARRESGLKNLISPPMSPGLEGKRKSSMGRIREMAGFKEEK